MGGLNPKKQVAHKWDVEDVWARSGWEIGKCIPSAKEVLKHAGRRALDFSRKVTIADIDEGIKLFNKGEIKPCFSAETKVIIDVVKKYHQVDSCSVSDDFVAFCVNSLCEEDISSLLDKLYPYFGLGWVLLVERNDPPSKTINVFFEDEVKPYKRADIKVDAMTDKELAEFRGFINSVACWDYLNNETARKVLEIIEKYNPIIKAEQEG